MKRRIYVFLVISLLVALMGTIGCAEGKGNTRGNSPETESFSTVVRMNGKELTVGALGLELPGHGGSIPEVVTVMVKNSGREPIAVAELELVAYNSDGIEGEDYKRCSSEEKVLSVKGLGRGEVQILYWYAYGISEPRGSFKAKVTRLE